MSRYYSDDPVRDAERYLDDEMRYSKSLPVCYGCGEQISPTTDPDSCEIFGHLYHEECVAEYALPEIIRESRVKTENYVGACWDGA